MTSKEPSQRQRRVAEEIRHILAETLARSQCGDPFLDNTPITVTEVQISPDFQHANVYVMPLGGQYVSEILSALKEKAWYFRKEVAHALKIRVTPKLVFHVDTSFDEAERIESLLQSIKVKQDTEKKN
jgi:ribosome-binding factor A